MNRRVALLVSAVTAIGGLCAPGSSAHAAIPGDDVDCRHTKCVALTFDDGPGAHTARLLETLRRKNARATFFVIGQNVDARPHLVRELVADGHEVGNHTYTHPQLTRLSTNQVVSQRQRTDDAIRRAAGVTPRTYRPPYGVRDGRVDGAMGKPAVLWTLDTKDWQSRSVVSNIRAAAGARPGDILLMHDIHAPTVDAVPEIIDGLQRRGFRLVTVSHLNRTGGSGGYVGPVASAGPSAPVLPPRRTAWLDNWSRVVADPSPRVRLR